jgi:hypothetical protein
MELSMREQCFAGGYGAVIGANDFNGTICFLIAKRKQSEIQMNLAWNEFLCCWQGFWVVCYVNGLDAFRAREMDW